MLCYRTQGHPDPCQTQPPQPLCLPPGHLANASTELMKLDHDEEPQLSEPYLSKQKKLMVSRSKPHTFLAVGGHDPWTCHRHLVPHIPAWLQGHVPIHPSIHPFPTLILLSTQAKILEHDNVNYLKKILGELGMVLDQIEAELEKRKLEYQGTGPHLWGVFPHETDVQCQEELMALHLMNIPMGDHRFWVYQCCCSCGLTSLRQTTPALGSPRTPCQRGQQDLCPRSCSVGALKSLQGGGRSPPPQ